MSTRADTAIRDIPRTCLCVWTYQHGPARWVRGRADPDCAWHKAVAA